VTPFWIGLTIEQFVAIAGESEYRCRNWLRNHGYRWGDGKIALPGAARPVAEPQRVQFSEPCSYCGAARMCWHRGALAA